MVNVNYPMELVDGSPVAHTAINGATRQISGTQNSRSRIPTLEEEPLWMKLSTTAPAPAGCAMFRDIRAWHGGILWGTYMSSKSFNLPLFLGLCMTCTCVRSRDAELI